MSAPQKRSLLREPLVHFLALGALLFLIGWATGDEQGPMGSRIVVTPGEVDRLAASFAATWQRPPTERELQGLVEDHIREEVYFREALALGLDRDDIIIRRRLRQKVEFLTQDLADAVAPTDDELRRYLDENQAHYLIPDRYTFSQRLYRTDTNREGARPRAEAALEALADPSAPEPAPSGDPSMLPERMGDVPAGEVVRVFGERFLEGLEGAPEGSWSAPIESGYGIHLVYVRERVPGRPATLDEVRPLVVRDWTTKQRAEVNDAVYSEMLARYTVVMEGPDGTERVWTGSEPEGDASRTSAGPPTEGGAGAGR